MRTKRSVSLPKWSKCLLVAVSVLTFVNLVSAFVYHFIGEIQTLLGKQEFYNLLNETRDNKNIPLTATGDPYKIKNPAICERNSQLRYIILVQSATNHFKIRHTVRKTWGMFGEQKDKPYEVVFLLGEPQSQTDQALIEEENAEFCDIVQGRFLDTYYNLTLKTVLGIRWVAEHCSKAVYVVKVDDHMVLNIFRLDDLLKDRQRTERKMICHYREKGSHLALIERSGKWKTDAYPGLTHYPFGFCPGYGVLMSADLAKPLFHASERTPFFWLEDVYFSGILAQLVGNISYEYLKGMTHENKETLACFSRKSPCTLLAASCCTTGCMENTWTLMVQQDIQLQYVDSGILKEWLSKPSINSKIYLQNEKLPTVPFLCVYLCTLLMYVLWRNNILHE